MNLKEWWDSQPPQKKQEIDRRVPVLQPNTDLAGKHDGYHGRQTTCNENVRTSRTTR
jgi:hypothetical protein